ncbi:MAG: spermidine/putrescine ABC transporter substrate-binding protein, partial [Clostridia bacterium]|nr:spermidine/putrescine ABC transporter substrate-binding protein [Clostridia bacterium]
MKKIQKIIAVSLCLVILAAAFLMTSCKSDGGEVTTIYVYNWGEYISDGSEDSLDSNKAFEEWYFDTYGERVKVSYSTYSSNEDMYAKLSGGAVNYDVIVPSDYMIERLIEEDALAPLDYSNIPLAKENLSPAFFGEDAEFDYYDEGNVYSVPYFYGMIGIIYNTEMVDEADIGSWSLMWNEKYKGNILQFNNSRDAFGTAQYYLGIDVNTDDESEWREALELLKTQKSIVQGYVMDEIFNKMEGGSAAIAAYYAGDFLTMYENNENLDFFYPEEGTNLYIDAMCIPKTSENKLIAERYINFMLSVDENYGAPAIANAE